MDFEVEHQVDAQRFVVNTEQGESELTYTQEGKLIDFTRTFVHPENRGSPIGRTLVATGVEWAEAQGADIVASCWYVDKFLKRRAEKP